MPIKKLSSSDIDRLYDDKAKAVAKAVKEQHSSFKAEFDLGEPPIKRTVQEAYSIFADSILLRLKLWNSSDEKERRQSLQTCLTSWKVLVEQNSVVQAAVQRMLDVWAAVHFSFFFPSRLISQDGLIFNRSPSCRGPNTSGSVSTTAWRQQQRMLPPVSVSTAYKSACDTDRAFPATVSSKFLRSAQELTGHLGRDFVKDSYKNSSALIRCYNAFFQAHPASAPLEGVDEYQQLLAIAAQFALLPNMKQLQRFANAWIRKTYNSGREGGGYAEPSDADRHHIIWSYVGENQDSLRKAATDYPLLFFSASQSHSLSHRSHRLKRFVPVSRG